MSPFAACLLGLLAVMLVMAAWGDVRSRIIPNGLNAAIALLALPWWLAIGLGWSDIGLQLLLAGAVLGLFALCFALGMMGGGDVKLLAALALWLPFGRMAVLLVWMALLGGVLTLGMMAARRIARSADPIEVPYGVAIVAAALMVVTNQFLTTAVA